MGTQYNGGGKSFDGTISKITLTGSPAIDFTNTGSQTYTKTVVYNDSTYDYLTEVARETNAVGGVGRDFLIANRGGTAFFQAGELKTTIKDPFSVGLTATFADVGTLEAANFSSTSGNALTLNGAGFDLWCNGNGVYSTNMIETGSYFACAGVAGWTGTLNDSTSTAIAEVQGGIIWSTYY